MNLRDFDLNFLRVLDALLKESSVTAAARRLHLSQSTVSTALSRLREAFNDLLFIKTAHGMRPTPRAQELRAPLDEVMASIRSALFTPPAFDPRATERMFTVLSGEIGQMVLAQHLFARVREAAPRTAIRVISALQAERPCVLEDGHADLAIRHFPQFAQSNFFQQLLYARPLVCVARQGHPAFKDGRISLQDFLQQEHAVFGTESNLQSGVDAELRRHHLKRRIVIELANVSSAPHVLARCDAVSVMPETLVQIFRRTAPLDTAALPFALPVYEIKQFWHPRVNRDPAITWLRQLVRSEFQQR